MQMKRLGWIVMVLTVAGLILAACQAPTAVPPIDPPPTHTHTPPPATPTIPPSPTATPLPTSLPAATVTEPPPPSPTAVATVSTATATATAVIPGLIGPIDYPPNVNPLTGLTVADPDVLQRRPFAVKISNYPPLVRPQAGLSSADLVFEHYAEGSTTRFTAVFYSQDADPVGSIRSGRLIDLEIPRMYDAAFAYSGSAGRVRLMFKDSVFFDRIISPDFAHGGFYRVEDTGKPYVHTLFSSLETLRFLLEERGQEVPPQFEKGMAFREEPLAQGEPVSRIEIPYGAAYVTWVYDRGDGRYYRWTDGEAHLDANNESQLNFKNIIVVAAHHQATDIMESDLGDGSPSIQIQIWGEGPASIFRDGQRFDGVWRREDPDQMLTFYDLEGNILPLAPGASFFQIVPLGFDKLITE